MFQTNKMGKSLMEEVSVLFKADPNSKIEAHLQILVMQEPFGVKNVVNSDPNHGTTICVMTTNYHDIWYFIEWGG